MGAAVQILGVPPGYPAYLPKPVLRDGGLYLDPYPSMPEKTVFTIAPADYAWVMVALQPWVLKYSPQPYDVNWVIDGWGSGKVHIAAALTGKFAGSFSMGKPVPQENFLIHPREPTGFDKFLISLNRSIGDIMGKLFEAFIPGTGSTIRKLVGEAAGSWDPLAQGVDLSPVYQQIEEQQSGGDQNNKLMLWGGLALLGIAWWYYEGDT